jgi:hypothetical protein
MFQLLFLRRGCAVIDGCGVREGGLSVKGEGVRVGLSLGLQEVRELQDLVVLLAVFHIQVHELSLLVFDLFL